MIRRITTEQRANVHGIAVRWGLCSDEEVAREGGHSLACRVATGINLAGLIHGAEVERKRCVAWVRDAEGDGVAGDLTRARQEADAEEDEAALVKDAD